MGDFATPKTQGDLAFVAFSQKALDVAHLDVVVAVIGTGAELDLLDFDHGLLGFGFSSFLLFLVLEFAVIHQTTHGRIGGGSNLDQVHVQLTRHAQCVIDIDNTQGLVFNPREADLRDHDFPIQSVFAFFAVTAITKFGSDDLILHKNCHMHRG